MNARYASGREQIHFDSVLVDLHAHPALNVSLFHRTLTSLLYREEDIQEIPGGNALRVLMEEWKR